MLGDALKYNTNLVSLDLSKNSMLDDNVNLHEDITNSIATNTKSALRSIFITTSNIEVKAHYLELIDQKRSIKVFANGKPLEDVDMQE